MEHDIIIRSAMLFAIRSQSVTVRYLLAKPSIIYTCTHHTCQRICSWSPAGVRCQLELSFYRLVHRPQYRTHIQKSMPTLSTLSWSRFACPSWLTVHRVSPVIILSRSREAKYLTQFFTHSNLMASFIFVVSTSYFFSISSFHFQYPIILKCSYMEEHKD